MHHQTIKTNKKMNLANYSCKYFGGSETLASYLCDVRKYEVPTPEEEEILFERINGDDKRDIERAKNEIIVRNQRFVYAIAKIYARNEDEVLDYVNEGNVGLIESIDKFDPTMGFKFITYAVNYIKREMNYYMYTTNRIVKRPNSMKIGKKVETVRHKFFAENGYEPSDEEILEAINSVYGLKIKDKSDLFDVAVTSISDSYDDDDKNTVENNEEYNRKTSSQINYEKDINEDYNSKLADKILSSLPEDVCDILKMYMGIGYERKCTVEEIGDKYDIDKNTIVQTVNNALAYLRQNKRKFKMAV